MRFLSISMIMVACLLLVNVNLVRVKIRGKWFDKRTQWNQDFTSSKTYYVEIDQNQTAAKESKLNKEQEQDRNKDRFGIQNTVSNKLVKGIGIVLNQISNKNLRSNDQSNDRSDQRFKIRTVTRSDPILKFQSNPITSSSSSSSSSTFSSFSSQTEFGGNKPSTNQVSGKNNLIIKGQFNKINGQQNFIAQGNSNSVKGNSNSIQAGNNNLIRGSGNSVSSLDSPTSSTQSPTNKKVQILQSVTPSKQVDSTPVKQVVPASQAPSQSKPLSTKTQQKTILVQDQNNNLTPVQTESGQSTNQVTGKSNLIVKGQSNQINGQENIIDDGNSNSIRGNSNIIQKGDNNLIRGNGNSVSSLNKIQNNPFTSSQSPANIKSPVLSNLTPSKQADSMTTSARQVPAPQISVQSKVQVETKKQQKTVLVQDSNNNLTPVNPQSGESTNQVTGKNNLIVKGQSNRINGEENVIDDGNFNSIRGNSNTIQKGDNNLIRGSGNFISGSNNFIQT